MSILNSKVVWSEGIFITPQHFQQQERYFEERINESLKSLQAFYYGVHDIQFDQNGLNQGIGVCQHSCHPYLNQATKTSVALTRLDRRTGLRAVG